MINTLKSIIRKFKSNEAGATAIEYGLCAALIAVGMISGAKNIATSIDAQFACTSVRLANTHQTNAKVRYKRCIRRRT